MQGIDVVGDVVGWWVVRAGAVGVLILVGHVSYL
jgi:hypothetical protein